MSFELPGYADTVPQPQNTVDQPDHPEEEVLADEDGGRFFFSTYGTWSSPPPSVDPIDPGFIPPKSPLIQSLKPPTEPPKLSQEEPVPEPAPEEEDEEQGRKRRMAERMAKLGGIRLGAPPPVGRPAPPKTQREVEEEEEKPKVEEQPEEEEEEQARRQRIATKLAGMGGMRIGMVPGAVPPKPATPSRKSSTRVQQPEQKSPPPLRSPPPIRAPPPPTQPPPPRVRPDTGSFSEDDGVKVEMEESDGEEVDYHDIGEEVPPVVPSRVARPPIPSPGHFRKASTDSTTSVSHPAPARIVPPTPSEYVMVEEPESGGELTSPPPRPARPPPPRVAPPPPAPSSDVPDSMTMSQWELPPVPSSSLDMETSVADLSASSWSEGFTTEEPAQEKTLRSSPSIRRQSQGQMTADQLTTTWGRVGIQICEVAVELFEKSKKSLIGDGTFVGFVNAVLDKVPNASPVEEDASAFGYLIYAQTGSSVTKRAAEIMPGDIITLQDAKLKGHKGIQNYHQNVGEGTPVVAVIGEYEPKKFKAKAYQASQHVGNQVSYAVSHALAILMRSFRPSSPLVTGWKI